MSTAGPHRDARSRNQRRARELEAQGQAGVFAPAQRDLEPGARSFREQRRQQEAARSHALGHRHFEEAGRRLSAWALGQEAQHVVAEGHIEAARETQSPCRASIHRRCLEAHELGEVVKNGS